MWKHSRLFSLPWNVYFYREFSMQRTRVPLSKDNPASFIAGTTERFVREILATPVQICPAYFRTLEYRLLEWIYREARDFGTTPFHPSTRGSLATARLVSGVADRTLLRCRGVHLEGSPSLCSMHK